MSKVCLICLETCETPGTLDLNCDCNYIVHKDCFDKWYRINKKCIICHKKCNSIKKHDTIILKHYPQFNIYITYPYNGLLFWGFFILFFNFISFFNKKVLQNNNTLEN
jgi:hypothetical protein